MNRDPHRGVQCPDCNKRMFSYSRHNYKTCGCDNETMVDGGKDYLRYGGIKMPIVIEFDEEIDNVTPDKRRRS